MSKKDKKRSATVISNKKTVSASDHIKTPTQSATLQAVPSNKLKWYWILPILLTALVHFNGIQNGFVNLDDELYILRNTWITELSAENIKTMFSDFLGGNYHPLVTLSNAIDYAIAGEHSAKMYHLVNYLFHLANTFLVFLFIQKLSKGKLLVSALVAALFGVHPMHVESVAWISERKDVLYAFFYLLSLIQYLNYKAGGATKHIMLSLLFFVLSCLSKSMAVTLPMVLLLIDYYYDEDTFSFKKVLNKLLFFAFALSFGIVALYSQKAQGYIADYNFNFLQKLFMAGYSAFYYVIQLIAPFNLSCLHPFPKGSLPMQYYIYALVFLAGAIFILLKGNKQLKFGLLFFVFSVSIVLQIISVGAAVVCERYTYMPYIGLFFILAYYVSEIYEGRILPNLQKVILPISVVVCLIFSGMSMQRNQVWKDGESLWRDCTAKNAETADYAWFGLGNILKEKYSRPDSLMDGQTKPSKEEILAAYAKAVEINPNFPNYYLNGAAAKSDFGDLLGALTYLDKAVQLKPDFDQALYNRGIIKVELKDFQGAVNDYSKAIQVSPTYKEAIYNRAIAYKNMSQFDLAIADYNKVLQMDPNFVSAYNNLGNIYYNLKQYPQAIDIYNRGIALNPQTASMYLNRGAAKMGMGDKAGACIDFNTALQNGDMNAKDAIAHLCN